jgi:AraC-like DNA-binding protein
MTSFDAVAQQMFAGAAVGALAVLGVALARSNSAAGARLAALLCLAGIGTYGVASLPNFGGALAGAPVLGTVVTSLVCGTIGFYVVAARASFSDRPAGIVAFWPAALLILLGIGAIQANDSLRVVFFALYLGSASALLVYVTRLIIRGRAGDLVESRRRLRGPAAALTLVFCLAALVDIALSTTVRFGLLRDWMTLEREGALAGLAIAAASLLLRVRPDLAHAPRAAPAADADDVVYEAVGRLMDVDEAWRKEGLSVAALSVAANFPEYRVRRVILTRFEARNFSAFVNAYRIEAAKALLKGQNAGRANIADIAFEVGFNSLTAFNRAFKEVAGETPTAWRRRRADTVACPPSDQQSTTEAVRHAVHFRGSGADVVRPPIK